jgi:RNA polymerase sigma-70 factor (ECF subfamily)
LNQPGASRTRTGFSYGPARVYHQAVSGPLTDEALLTRCAAGDERALAVLYDRFGRAAYALARRITRDETLAEDVVQEAFLDAWRGARRFDPDRGKATTWLFTFVHRRAVDAVRRSVVRARPVPIELRELEAAEDDVAGTIVARESAAEIWAALPRLPRAQRRVLELAYFDGYTQSEIAEVLGEPLGTVKSRTHAALTRLRELIVADGMPSHDLPEETAALLSAHALGALEQDEAAEAERLIAGSDVCRRVFEEALETAAALTLAVEATEPPPELGARIVEAARRLRDGDSDP